MVEPSEPAATAAAPADEPRENPLMAKLAPVLDFHYHHPIYFWAIVLGLVAAVLTIGARLAPEVFLHGYIWQDIWGPTVADANQRGVATRYGMTVSEDYTLKAEITYGLTLAAVLPSIYVHLFKKRGITFDGRFIGSLMPYVLFGPLVRVLEDSSVFCELGTSGNRGCDPGLWAPLFISPFLYMVAAAVVITHILLAQRVREADLTTQRTIVGAWLAAQTALYAFVFYAMRGEFVIMIAPYTMAALAVLAYGVYHVARARGGRHGTWAIFAWGVPMMLIPVVLIAQWEIVGAWVSHAKIVSGVGTLEDPGVPSILLWVFGGAGLIVGAAYAVGRGLQDRFTWAGSFVMPLNLGLIAGHMIDGLATFAAICSDPRGTICAGAQSLGITVYGYGEKHPVSAIFLDHLDGWAFPLVKLLLVVTIILIIDRSAREGGEDPNLVGLVKFVVLILGLGPGLRDVLRVAMGV